MKSAGRLVFVGCVETGFFCAKRLVKAGIIPEAIVSIDNATAERSKVSGYKDLFDLDVDCEKYRPETYSMKSEKDQGFFSDRRFDILVVLGWQRLIPADIINTLRICGLTIHGSGEGLPKGRGRSPMNWAIIKGFDRFFLSLLTLSPSADGGVILDTQEFDILPEDDIRTLYYKNSLVSSTMLEDNIPRLLAREKYGEPQDENEATYYPKRTPEDGKINWRQGAERVTRLVRAVTKPYPGAFTFCGGAKIMIWSARLFDTKISGPEAPGVVAAVFPDGAFIVKTADYYVVVSDYDGNAPRDGDLLE